MADGAFDDLFVLQEHDLTLDRLKLRHDTLPERAAVAGGDARVAALDAQLSEARAQRDVVARREKALDDEASSLQAKAAEVERKMYSGEIASPKELQAMGAEVEQLRRHQAELETEELDLMEQREPLDAEVARLEAELAAAQGELAAVRARLAAGEVEVKGEARAELATRQALAGRLDPKLVAEYERCRSLTRGTGVARLVGLTCQGCHLSIPSTEAERIRHAPEGTIEHCDNCGAILVAS